MTLLVGACGTSSGKSGASPTSDLTGQSYVSMAPDAVTPHHLVPGSQLRLSFTSDGIATSAGCNTMSGAATLDNGTLVLDGPMSSTQMACSPALMRQDQWWADLLSNRPQVDAAVHSVVIRSNATTVTLTNEHDAVPNRSLTGTVWLVDSIADGDTVSSLPAGAAPTTTFGPLDVRLVACNHFTATYHADASALTVSRWHLVGTPKPCPSSAAPLYDAIMQVLSGQVSFVIDGDRLTITNQSRSVGFRAAATG